MNRRRDKHPSPLLSRLLLPVVSLDHLLGWPLLRRLPLVGEINDEFFAPDAQINDPEFGSSMALPVVMEILVDKERSMPAGVGRQADRALFPDLGKLLFNVCFSCGKAPLFGPGVYGDPTSHWFNVFFGYYEIDVPKSQWSRPFGYARAGKDAPVLFEDILRIGKADWNYFSNWVYGVPDAAIEPCNNLNDPLVETRRRGRHAVGEGEFDLIELDNVEVVSSYTSGKPGDGVLVDKDPLFSPLWRMNFGQPCPRPERPERSFFSTRMKARILMAYREVDHDEDLGEAAYQTFLFGGTIWRDFPDAQKNERFLQAQMHAVEAVIRRHYPTLGFR
jgi:hypothetical protein